MYNDIKLGHSLNVCAWSGIIIILLGIYNHYLKRKQYQQITDKLPTLYGLPFIGVAYQLIPIEKFLYQMDVYFKQLNTLTYCAWVGGDPFIITIDPELIKTITSSGEMLDKADILYKPINNAIDNGILTSPTAKWKHNRKLINMFFTHQTLLDFVYIFNGAADVLTQRFRDLVDKGEQNVFELFKRAVLEMALETTMGVKPNEEMHEAEQVVDAFRYVMSQIAHDALYSSFKMGFLAHTPKYHKSLRNLRAYIRKLIKRYQTEGNETQMNNNNSNNNNACFLKQALAYYEKGLFDEDDLINESMTMIPGSFETVSTALFSTLVMLAMHPEVQQKLSQEVDRVYPDKTSFIDYELIKQAPYLDLVIAETLRLLPSIPVIGRQMSHDTQLTEDLKLPKGTQIIIPIFNLHRSERHWGPSAGRFEPERFLDTEAKATRHPFAYMPFSKGARMCIGWRYAEIALRVVLLKLVRNFKFSTTARLDDLVFIDHISLWYKVEPKLTIKIRQ